LSQMWLTIDVYEKELPKLKVDQRVTFTVEGMDSKVVRGKVVSIGAAVDDRTRTIPVRASLKNKERLLRANMFGRAQVVVHDEEEVLVLPREAVQWEGCHNVVFVRIGPSTYQTRKVELGWTGSDHVEARSGVLAGDVVVTRGSFLMKTEILKGTIGAGCCD
ncbi:MAG: efflux RND transporter periplasmic adaptor subunit, partial [Planctomycetota bacterium]